MSETESLFPENARFCLKNRLEMQIKHKKIGLFLPKLADQEIYPYICAQK